MCTGSSILEGGAGNRITTTGNRRRKADEIWFRLINTKNWEPANKDYNVLWRRYPWDNVCVVFVTPPSALHCPEEDVRLGMRVFEVLVAFDDHGPDLCTTLYIDATGEYLVDVLRVSLAEVFSRMHWSLYNRARAAGEQPGCEPEWGEWPGARYPLPPHPVDDSSV